MEVLWVCGELSIKQIRGSLCLDEYCTYENVQTTIYGLERKNAVRRVDKVERADIFEGTLTREAAYGRLVDDFYSDFLKVFGGRRALILVHLVEAGALTIDELKQAGHAAHCFQRHQMLARQEDARRR